jgi:hypothetical protein
LYSNRTRNGFSARRAIELIRFIFGGIINEIEIEKV